MLKLEHEVWMRFACAFIASGGNLGDATEEGDHGLAEYKMRFPRSDGEPAWEGHAIVDLSSRVRIIGRVREVRFCGADMLEVQELVGPDTYGPSERYNGRSAVYCVKPISREAAIGMLPAKAEPAVEVAA